MDQQQAPAEQPSNQQPDPMQTTHHTVVSLDQSSEERVLGSIGHFVQTVVEVQGQTQLESLRIQAAHQKEMTLAHHGFVMKLAWPAYALVAATIGGCLILREPQQAVELVKVIALGFAGLGVRAAFQGPRPAQKEKPGA